MLNDRIIRNAFLASLAGHCLFLGVSGFNSRLPHQERKPEEIMVKVEIEKQALMPRTHNIVEKQPGHESKPRPQPIEAIDPLQEALLCYQDRVKQRIEEAKRYPIFAKRQGIEGAVHLSFTVLFNGRSKDIKIVRSSDSKILDEEAIETIKRAGPFPPFPKEINRDFILMEVVLIFNLEKT